MPVAWHLASQGGGARGTGGVAALGVGDSQEAMELRRAGIAIPIVILGTVVHGELADVVANDIAVTVGDELIMESESDPLLISAAGAFAFANEQPAAGGSYGHNQLIESTRAYTEQVTIDAGYKSLSTDGGTAVVRRGAPLDAQFRFMGDEHGALVSPGIGDAMAPGDPVTLTVPHCDPTVNLYDTYHVVRGETLVDLWPVSARGRAR